MSPSDLVRRFSEIFGSDARVFRAPGRVNLIGEHVDYNEGLVLPMAIDRHCYVAAAARPGPILRSHSAQFDETVELSLDQLSGGQGHWSDYVAGVAWSLIRAGKDVGGADILVDSDVPSGAGLSSSAALEVATATALLAINEQTLDPIDVALVCQRAENRYVGAECGVMDQLTACLGRESNALLIDCRSLDVDYVPIHQDGVQVMVANTMVMHDLAAGEYNRRRQECREVLELVQAVQPGVRALRDLAPGELEALAADMPETLRRRARHVVTEIERVRAATAALPGGDFAKVGRFMYESHASLAADYEVSCPELDTMVDIARSLPGVYGARMTGGGFGGCTVNLLDPAATESIADELGRRYHEAVGQRAEIFVCAPAEGAAEVGQGRLDA